jgi:hypothetical protein
MAGGRRVSLHTPALAVAACAALAGCLDEPLTTTVELKAPAAVHVVGLGGTPARDYPADSEVALRLKTWVDANRTGWLPYLATAPSAGLMVRADDVQLQFIGDSVIDHDAHGLYVKSVAPSDYAFLRQ